MHNTQALLQTPSSLAMLHAEQLSPSMRTVLLDASLSQPQEGTKFHAKCYEILLSVFVCTTICVTIFGDVSVIVCVCATVCGNVLPLCAGKW